MQKLAVVLLLFVACDKRVVEANLPSHVEEREVSCSHYGYCYGCGPSMSMSGGMKTSCGFAWRSCSGEQKARVKVTPYRWHYETRPEEPHVSEDVEIVERLGTCR